MKQYFALQKTLTDRWWRANGVAPPLGYGLALLLVLAVGWLALARTDYAAYGIVAASLSALLPLAERRRNDFLRITFGKRKQQWIRLVENFVVVSPLLVLLLARQFWALALVQGMLGGAMAVWPVGSWNGVVIPTPFSRRPFEFAVGFRKHWPLLGGAVFLLVMGVRVGNFALGGVAFFAVALLAQGWHSEPEPGSYIHVFSLRPRPFLRRKMSIAAGQLLLLLLPFTLTLLVGFPERWPLILLFVLVAQGFVQAMITAKYAAYPDRISLPRSFLLALGMVAFPLLPLLIVYFYRKAVSRLHLFLPESSPAC